MKVFLPSFLFHALVLVQEDVLKGGDTGLKIIENQVHVEEVFRQLFQRLKSEAVWTSGLFQVDDTLIQHRNGSLHNTYGRFLP